MLETYNESQEVLWSQIKRFRRRIKHPDATPDNLLSIANEVFVIVYTDFDDTKSSSFSKRLSFLIWFRFLREFVQIPTQEKRRVTGETRVINMAEHEIAEPTKPSFDITEFLEELSIDAKMIVKLVIDTPKDLRSAINKEHLSSHLKSGIKHYLTGLGWTTKRVTESFSEISTALLK